MLVFYVKRRPAKGNKSIKKKPTGVPVPKRVSSKLTKEKIPDDKLINLQYSNLENNSQQDLLMKQNQPVTPQHCKKEKYPLSR